MMLQHYFVDLRYCQDFNVHFVDYVLANFVHLHGMHDLYLSLLSVWILVHFIVHYWECAYQLLVLQAS